MNSIRLQRKRYIHAIVNYDLHPSVARDTQSRLCLTVEFDR
jgi:hypothetical protein